MNTDKLFITALENKDIESLRKVPKTDFSTSIMNWLADHKIQLNICPTSNVLLNRVFNAHDLIRLEEMV